MQLQFVLVQFVLVQHEQMYVLPIQVLNMQQFWTLLYHKEHKVVHEQQVLVYVLQNSVEMIWYLLKIMAVQLHYVELKTT